MESIETHKVLSEALVSFEPVAPSVVIPRCELFDEFSWTIQLLLGSLCFSVLLIKRLKDKGKRPLIVFIFDTSKQALGTLTLHAYNLLVSHVQSRQNTDPCTWYLINILVDTTIGVLACHFLLKLFCFLFPYNVVLEFGFYGDPPTIRALLPQLGVWLVIVSLMKLFMILFMAALRVPLYTSTILLLYPFESYPKLKLVFVMVISPCVMNAFQYWVIDNIVMSKRSFSMMPTGTQDRICESQSEIVQQGILQGPIS